MKHFQISESEWKVMQVLWNNPKSTLKEIAKDLNDENWRYTTVRTLVTRLMKKGAIAADKTEGYFKYYPVAVESECKQAETRSFVSRVFNGSVSMLVSTLVKDSNLSEEEHRELLEIIAKIDGGDKK